MKELICVLCIAFVALPHARTFSAAPIWRAPPSSKNAGIKSWGVRPSPARRRTCRTRAPTALGAEKLAVGAVDVKRALSMAQERLQKNRRLFDEAKLQGELEYLEGVSSEADFWNDAASARKTLGELNRWGWFGAVWAGLGCHEWCRCRCWCRYYTRYLVWYTAVSG